MSEEKTKRAPSNESRSSFKIGLWIYVVSEAIAIGALVYYLLQRHQ